MKHIKYFSFFALMTFAINATAQSTDWTIATASSLVGDNSIIREWGTNCIIYTDESSTSGKFSLVSESYYPTQNIKHVPLRFRYKVRDFVILGDTVFFVGNYNNRGFWGYFNINTVFGNGDSIRYYLTKRENLFIGENGTVGWYREYLDFDELQVVQGSGPTQLLFVGDMKETLVDNINPWTTHTPCLIHVTIGSSNFEYAYNNASSEHFDDIALVNNNIVVVSRETNATDTANLLFRTYSLPFSSLSSNVIYSQTTSPSVSKVHITPITGNIFATVHHGRTNAPTLNKGLFVEYYTLITNYYSQQITRFSFSHTPFPGGFSGAEDIRGSVYNASSSTLSVLLTTNALGLSNPESVLYKFDCSSYPASSCSTAYKANQGILLHSLCNGSGSHFIASGRQASGLLAVRDLYTAPSSCLTSSTATVTAQSATDNIGSSPAPLEIRYYTAIRQANRVTPTTIQYTVSCQ